MQRGVIDDCWLPAAFTWASGGRLMNRWRPSLIALDIDVFLMQYQGISESPTPALVAAIQRARDCGIHIVLTTGRWWQAAVQVHNAFGMQDGYVVCSNGAVVVDVESRRLIYLATFDASDAVHFFAKHVPGASFAVEEPGLGYRGTVDFPEGELNGRFTVVEHAELLHREVTRLVVQWSGGNRDVLHQIALSSGLKGVCYAIRNDAWLDVVRAGISKVSGLRLVASLLSISPDDVLAMGDNHSDIEMLVWAGHSVATEQAPADVQAIADEVCSGVEEDGHIAVLDRYLDESARN